MSGPGSPDDALPVPDDDPLSPAVRSAIEDRMAEYVPEGGGHGLAHHRRVARIADRIAAAEDADRVVVAGAALVHDVHRAMGPDDEYVHPRESLPVVGEILRDAGFPGRALDGVEHAVAVHDEYPFEPNPAAVETLEAAILQDADNVDAIGAVGVARCFAHAGQHGSRLYDPEYDPAFDLAGEDYHKDGDGEGSTSAFAHFHRKLLKLADATNTDAGARLAEPRHDFLETFVDRFEDEWWGGEASER